MVLPESRCSANSPCGKKCSPSPWPPVANERCVATVSQKKRGAAVASRVTGRRSSMRLKPTTLGICVFACRPSSLSMPLRERVEEGAVREAHAPAAR